MVLRRLVQNFRPAFWATVPLVREEQPAEQPVALTEREVWQRNRLAAAHIASNVPPYDFKAYHANIAASHLDIRGKKVLVIGCNRGEDCRMFVDMEAGEVTGVDVLDEIGVNFSHPRVGYVTASVESIPFPDGVFDFVFAYATLEHVRGVDAALREMCRVCASGGVIYSAASPLWNSRQGPHWGNTFDGMPWIHLRRDLQFIQAYNSSERLLYNGREISIHEISYWLDDRFFSKRFAREYLAAGWNVPNVEVIKNELEFESEDALTDDVYTELAALGYSKLELLALTHIFCVRAL